MRCPSQHIQSYAAAHCCGDSAAQPPGGSRGCDAPQGASLQAVAAPRSIGGMAGPAGPAHGEPSASDGGTAADNAEGRDGRRVVPDGYRRVALVHVACRNHASQIHHDSKKAHCQLWTGDPGQHSPHTQYHPEAAMASRWHGSRHGPAMPPQVVTRGRWEGGREKHNGTSPGGSMTLEPKGHGTADCKNCQNPLPSELN